jgi:hypothetical protein
MLRTNSAGLFPHQQNSQKSNLSLRRGHSKRVRQSIMRLSPSMDDLKDRSIEEEREDLGVAGELNARSGLTLGQSIMARQNWRRIAQRASAKRECQREVYGDEASGTFRSRDRGAGHGNVGGQRRRPNPTGRDPLCGLLAGPPLDGGRWPTAAAKLRVNRFSPVAESPAAATSASSAAHPQGSSATEPVGTAQQMSAAGALQRGQPRAAGQQQLRIHAAGPPIAVVAPEQPKRPESECGFRAGPEAAPKVRLRVGISGHRVGSSSADYLHWVRSYRNVHFL